jgi:hypothetical protein
MNFPFGKATQNFEMNVSTLRGFVNREKILTPFTFAVLFPGQIRPCGPGARASRGKSIGGTRVLRRDPSVLPQSEAGPSGDPAGRPYKGRTMIGGKERLARPDQKVRDAS